MKRTSIALLMLSCLVPSQAQGDPVELGRHLIASDQSIREGVQLGLPGVFFWGFPDVGADLFGVELTADDVGRTFRSTAESDPRFASAAAMLTNGVTDRVQFSLRFADGAWGGEDDFEGLPPTFTMIPRPGDMITAISFRLDAFLREEGIDAGVPFRRWQYNGVVSIEGIRPGGTPGPSPDPVPEPGTIALVATGLGLAGLRSRAWRRSGT